jgi:hypothetical protein
MCGIHFTLRSIHETMREKKQVWKNSESLENSDYFGRMMKYQISFVSKYFKTFKASICINNSKKTEEKNLRILVTTNQSKIFPRVLSEKVKH